MIKCTRHSISTITSIYADFTLRLPPQLLNLKVIFVMSHNKAATPKIS